MGSRDFKCLSIGGAPAESADLPVRSTGLVPTVHSRNEYRNQRHRER
jgi:hypothetical protein